MSLEVATRERSGSGSGFRPRFDFLEHSAQCGLGHFGVIRRLGAQPITGREAQEAAKSQVGIRRDCAPPGNDFADALRGDANLLGEAILREPERDEKLLAEEFTRRHGFQFLHENM